jgi:hypothetical protein
MREFQNRAAQGDVFFRRVDVLPNGVKPVAAVNGRVVVTHSETGHDHVMVLDSKRTKTQAVEMFATDNGRLK